MPIGEALLAAVAEAVFGYALEQSGVADRVRAVLKIDPKHKAFQVALARAYTAFARQYPDLVASLFDESFLKIEAAPLLAQLLTRRGRPDPAELAWLWARHLGHDDPDTWPRLAEATRAAADFLTWLEAELAKDPALQALYDSQALDRIAENTDAIRRALEERFAQALAEARSVHIGGSVSQSLIVTGSANTIIQYPNIQVQRFSGLDSFSREHLLNAIFQASADLRNYRGIIAGIHLDRPEVDEIVDWITRAENDQRLGMLLDHPGSGKTVVMRDVLTRLEELQVPVLAIKADLLLGVQSRADLMEQLGLPVEVEECARQLAKEGLFVALLDQLDALSLTLTRDQRTLSVVLSTLARLREIPNVRILASCRTFDLHNDLRLSSIKVDRTFELRPLEDSQVEEVLRAVGVEPRRLLPGHLELLKTPLHLDVYVRTVGDATSPSTLERFESLQDLYAELWRLKILSSGPSSPSPDERIAVIYRLVDVMTKTQHPSAPEGCLDDLAEAARYLEREGIIHRDKGRWLFLHQTFLDYCYARRFVAKSSSLSQEVLNSPQGLFERTLIVQVLAYLRGLDQQRYIRELKDLLFAPDLRVHLRLLILDWLGALPDPTDEEFVIVQQWTMDATHRVQVLRAFSGNPAWFDRFDQGLLAQWLTSEDGKPSSVVISYLHSIINTRPAEVLEYVRSFTGRGQEWDAAAAYCLSGLEDWNDEEAVDLLCDLLAHGMSSGYIDLCFHNLARSNPAGGCRALRRYLDHRLDSLLAQEAVMTDKERKSLPQLDRSRDPVRWEQELFDDYVVDKLMSRAAQEAPEAVIEHLMPWFLWAISVSADNATQKSTLYRSDVLFSYGWYGEHTLAGPKFALRMAEALATLAQNNPDRFRSLAIELSGTEWLTIHRALAKAYLAAPEIYLDDIINYLKGDRRRLFLGDHKDPHYESRLLYATAFRLADPGQRLDLEALVLDWQPEWERRRLRSEGWFHIAFLASVPRDSLSERARRRLQELERKFPDYRPTVPRGVQVGTVGPPIEPDAQEKMSDEAWLSAMRKYDDSTAWGAPKEEFLKGGVIELSRSFEGHVKRAPDRFYRLALRFDEGISLHYVTAAISGLAGSDAPADWVVDLVRRNAGRLHGEFRREVCRALSKRAKDGIPDDILDLLADWALHDPDPKEELWRIPAMNEQPYYGGNPHFFGINTNRGSATITLVECSLRRNPPQVERAFHLLEQVAADPSTGVRACVIEALRWLLRYDDKRAFDIFERTVTTHPDLLRLRITHDFLYYCHRRLYERVHPFIEVLLANEDEEARQVGAKLACLVAFHELDAQPLAEQAITGDTAMRVGAAQVYARNLEFGDVQPACEVGLRRLLHDPEERVREEIGKCFLHLRPEHLSNLRPFIKDFLNSPSLRSGAEYLVQYLKSVAYSDHDLVLEATAHILDELGEAVLDIRTRWAIMEGDLVQLQLAVYQYASDSTVKEQAMGLFERLLIAGSRSARKALDEWDRT